MKGPLLALLTVITWAVLNVINRYCVLCYDINVIVFTVYMIFSSGVALMVIRKKVSPEGWKKGVGYSWLYTLMQIIRSFFMISAFLYISSAETSLLFNIEVVITYLLVYLFFRRTPYKWDYPGILLILGGFILFILTIPSDIRMTVVILILISATASCIRSVVVEETTIKNPENTLRQKCGISGYTMYVGGLILMAALFAIALAKYFLADQLSGFTFVLKHLPTLKEMLHPETIIAACASGFFINSLTTYLYYATLIHSRSEVFMAVRAFQPVITYLLELAAAIFYVGMRPELTTKDYFLGAVIIIGSLLILIIPKQGSYIHQEKKFITD